MVGRLSAFALHNVYFSVFLGSMTDILCFLQRLVANAEEVAFNDPPSGAAEQLILNQRLYRVLRYSHLSAFLRFIQQVIGRLQPSNLQVFHDIGWQASCRLHTRVMQASKMF